MITEFNKHFPELSDDVAILVQDPLNAPVTSLPDENDEAQTELIQLQEETSAKLFFEKETLITFSGLNLVAITKS